MSRTTHFFGRKSETASEAGLAQMQEFCHKVEQAFPDSVRVAMRLIEKRPPELDALAGPGRPGHELFARLVIKAINLKHGHPGSAPPALAFEALPPLACFRDAEAPDWGCFTALAHQSGAELVMLDATPALEDAPNALLSLEAHLAFAIEPRTIAVFSGPGEFVARRDWLLRLAASFAYGLPIGQASDHLARLLHLQQGIREDASYLTAFGYPLTRYLLAEG